MALQSGIFVTDFDVAGVSGNVVLQNGHPASERAVRLSQVKALGKQVEHQGSFRNQQLPHLRHGPEKLSLGQVD